MRVTLIGAGGIGSHLAPFVARYLASVKGDHVLTIVDGDTFEAKNRERQEFSTLGPKARVVAQDLARKHSESGLRIDVITEYVHPDIVETDGSIKKGNESNLDFILLDGEIIFLCVDNHKTRKIVSEFVGTLENVSLISGGNELDTGDVTVYLRKGGRDITPSLTVVFPEIANPKDKAPYELSCEALAAAGVPQILPMNAMVAVAMLSAFYRLIRPIENPVEHFADDVRGEGEFAVNSGYTTVYLTLERCQMVPRNHQNLLTKKVGQSVSIDETVVTVAA